MSNSALVSYTKISPHKTSPRNHTIDTITIHCMAGNLSLQTCGEIFQNAEASSNYGIDSEGRVAMYVEEADRSWASSNRENDHRAVTIEVANDGGEPDWHVSDKALEALIELCADICRRNGIKALKWKGDKNLIGKVDQQNMTVHRWFANKACPGDYLYNKHGYIADEVNKRLGAEPTPEPTPEDRTLKTGCKGEDVRELQSDLNTLNNAGLKEDGDYGKLTKAAVKDFQAKRGIADDGICGPITKAEIAAAKTEPKVEAFTKGDRVIVKKGSKTYEGKPLASFVYNRTHIITELKGDRAVISYNGVVVAAVNTRDLKK